MAVRLSSRNLGAIGASVPVPAYDRAALRTGIVHFGVGNFHRAHQASYLDALFNTGRDHDWAIIGAGVMPSDEHMRAALAEQDFLSTVVEQEAEANHARVIGSMVDFLPT
ncbi:MAG TPA: mannitol dehydrogenase family protein, partial [Mycobacterium sp.]|nr:mannitol dehydrogenase family protein [Mycobacterium sp.]